MTGKMSTSENCSEPGRSVKSLPPSRRHTDSRVSVFTSSFILPPPLRYPLAKHPRTWSGESVAAKILRQPINQSVLLDERDRHMPQVHCPPAPGSRLGK